MQKIKQHKSIFAILGVLLLLALSLCVSFFISSVVATTAVSIENNGSRLIAKSDSTPTSYQWLRADTVDGTFSAIDGATGKYYDITANDEGKYIKVNIDGVETEAVGPIGKLITMDIGKGAISLGTTYSGKDSDGNSVSGTHTATNIYVILHKENGTKTENNIVFSGNLPNAPFDVTLAGVNMGGTPTNHNQAPGNSGTNTPSTSEIRIPATSSAVKKVTLRLRDENIVRYISYYNGSDTNTPATVTSSLKITNINGDGEVEGGCLYVPVKLAPEEIEAFVNSKTNYNHWNAGIGGTDGNSLVQNLHIAGGKIQVVTTLGDNCTAIGAGGNGYCQMEISGGEVIAHCNGTGAAIGGGIGWNAAAGKADILISGGKIYAENHARITAAKDGINHTVGGVAIGSGSTFHSSGSDGTVTITGGEVEAYGAYGNGIGGGNSSSYAGGGATINITGGTVKANSIGGGNSAKGAGGSATITIDNDANVRLTKEGTDCDFCGIGGGNSLSGNGGKATITVKSGTINSDGSIGGGEGGGTGNGGDATVNIYGGNLTAASIGGGTGSVGGHGGAAIVEVTDGFIETGSIGGGKTNNPDGKLGYAKANISGGDIVGQFLMAAGGTEPCSFTMTGGILHGVNTADTSKFIYAQQNGAAVYMDDPNGIVSISGGTIKDCSSQNGGAIYMTAGTCTISGTASIENCTSTENGGAIYMGGGTMTVNGGNIKNNTASHDGGAVYLGGGTMTVYAGEISSNTANDSGGAAYIDGGNVKVAGGSVINNTATNNGGGIAVNNGNYRMIGGSVDNNTATNGAGGGIYVSADGHDVTVDVLSGSVSKNTAKGNGGAFAVVGKTDGTEKITVTVGVNKNHFDANGELITNCEHGSDGDSAYECPVLIENKSGASGGGIYVTGNTSTVLNIFCLEESGSQADGDNGQSHFMKVDGGKVTITTSELLDENNQTSYHGNTHIKSEVYVTGGQMDIWGEMTNPRLEDIITVDITKQDDYFKDHREVPTTEKYYKLLYFENFTDPVTNITTGQYKEIEVKQGDSVIISGNIYSHPGYTIKGWNTSNGRPDLDNYPQGTYENDRGWYKVGDEKIFDGTIIGDLTIYAIWEANGYTVVYDPNVPSGETYTGKMDNFNFTYDLPIELSKNQYARPGYDFVGWCKDADGSSKIYQDEETVTNLTTKKGEVVTLYAQWKECDHDPATHQYTYSVIDGGKTLKRDCSCGTYSEEARLSAENTVYDQDTHPAEIVYTSDKWKPVVVHEALDGDELVDNLPYHAGRYKASVTENGVTASVTYTIEKAEQPAPPKPIFDTTKNADGSLISIFPVDPSPISTEGNSLYDGSYKSYPEYRIVYYEGGTEYSTGWEKGADTLIDGKYAVQFELDRALTNYFVQARYSECDNYKASPESTADSVYFFAGNVEFVVNCGEGVVYTIKTADGSNVTENGIQIEVSAKDGYFFPKDYKASIKTENADSQAVLSPADRYSEIYSINNIPANSKVILTLPDAQKCLEIESNIAEKQEFGRITTTSATISRDSAYTVYFEVRNYSSAEYEPLMLTFDKELPVGTTIILQDRSNGSYYWTSIEAAGTKELALTSFVRMGDNSANNGFALSASDADLQFIVDFSQTANGIGGDSVTTTLSAISQTNSRSTTEQSDEIADLKNESSYTLTAGGAIGEISFVYSESEGAASKWDGRDDALVFKPKSDLPADAHLSIVCGNATTVIYANCDGNFVYSVPNQAEGTISVSLISNLLPVGSTEFSFDVEWIIAKSKVESSPMNVQYVAKTQVNAEGVGAAPVSLKIVGDKKLYALNEMVKATVSWADLPSNYKLEVVLMVKTENGDYSSTAVTQEVDFTTESGTQDISISLAGNKTGSYRLYLSAELGLITVAEAEYYFIVD